MPLHPDVQAVVDARGPVRLSSLGVDEARAAHAAGAAARPLGPEMDEITDTRLGDVPVRFYRPPDPSGGLLVFLHGGGWVLGSVETHDQQSRGLAAESGATVVSVEYRLAPEHPFPAAFDDAAAVTRQLLATAGDHGLDPERVGIGGDSAGGNLAAAVAIALRDAGVDPRLRAQLLVYPALDAEMASSSYDENDDGPFLSAAEMVWFYRHYQRDHPANDWRLSPLRAGDLTSLPPALVITAEFDPLRDEGEAYANALAEAGGTASAVRYSGASHGFFGWSHAAEPSRQAMAQAGHWLRGIL